MYRNRCCSYNIIIMNFIHSIDMELYARQCNQSVALTSINETYTFSFIKIKQQKT